MKKAFTLIELVISIVILSILMIFLYKSYSDLNLVNAIYTKEITKISKTEHIKETLYKDILLATYTTISITSESKNYDYLYMQTKNSIHQLINPYVSYIIHNKTLYRLESAIKIDSYPIQNDIPFIVDKIGEVEKFRIYPSQNQIDQLFLVQLKLKDQLNMVFKIKALN
jgi:prepilin-type N-terminal cleavage/methylation domain-containing protein